MLNVKYPRGPTVEYQTLEIRGKSSDIRRPEANRGRMMEERIKIQLLNPCWKISAPSKLPHVHNTYVRVLSVDKFLFARYFDIYGVSLSRLHSCLDTSDAVEIDPELINIFAEVRLQPKGYVKFTLKNGPEYHMFQVHVILLPSRF